MGEKRASVQIEAVILNSPDRRRVDERKDLETSNADNRFFLSCAGGLARRFGH
jgi:hypothetical protein